MTSKDHFSYGAIWVVRKTPLGGTFYGCCYIYIYIYIYTYLFIYLIASRSPPGRIKFGYWVVAMLDYIIEKKMLEFGKNLAKKKPERVNKLYVWLKLGPRGEKGKIGSHNLKVQ